MKTYKTTVLGLGPFCIEFDDGEIITTRDEGRQHLIAAAPELLQALKEVVSISDRKHNAWDKAHAAIAKAEWRS